MASGPQLVLVTGVNGFIASHVAEQLLAAGYRVRGTARGADTVKTLRDTYPAAGLEYMLVDDVASSDLTEALKGVDAVVHIASPTPGMLPGEELIKTSIDGCINVLRQGQKAGTTKFVMMGSASSVFDAGLESAFDGRTRTEADWSPTTYDEAMSHKDNPLYAYCAAKSLAEKAVWEFARNHPNIDVATILPGYVFGPYSKLTPPPTTVSKLGTNSFIWSLMNGENPPPAPPYIVDARDVAKAVVAALQLPLAPRGSLEDKRFLVNAGVYPWSEAAKALRAERPALVGVLDSEKAVELPGPVAGLDTSRSVGVLGMRYRDPRETVLDTADALVELGKSPGWKG